MGYVIGLDTGGTYTDAVLYERCSDKIVKWFKTPTIPGELTRCVKNAIIGLDVVFKNEIDSVHLSTTLATNAAVEEHLRPVVLFLIGYGRDWAAFKSMRSEEFGARELVFIDGSHDFYGRMITPLDKEELILEATRLNKPGMNIEAAAVSAIYGVRNPSHELEAREIIAKYMGRPVVCGHELASGLNAITRATTAALNAALIPILHEFLDGIRTALSETGLGDVPVMLLKGDGALIKTDSILMRPIETLLSGPAASAAGGEWLAKGILPPDAASKIVVDIGGTTTDIARTENSRPLLNEQGAKIGRFQTMVKAADIRTVGLGGDSAVKVSHDGYLVIGPERCEPLSSLAELFPEVQSEIMRDEKMPSRNSTMFVRKTAKSHESLKGEYARIMHGLDSSPVRYSDLINANFSNPSFISYMEDLWRSGFVIFSGFTPTDAICALGGIDIGNAALGAARWGAGILALNYRERLDEKEFSKKVVQTVNENFAAFIVQDALERGKISGDIGLRPERSPLIRGFLGINEAGPGMPEISMKIHTPFIVVGAPAMAYSERAGELFDAICVTPPLCGVASAIGTAISEQWSVREIEITKPTDDERYHLHLPTGAKVFFSLEDALNGGILEMTALLKSEAAKSGIDEPVIEVTRKDLKTEMVNGNSLYWGTKLIFETREFK
ncbi:MAG: hydantoinase/oxoprolinase family protein [Synergistaceae bacterium]|jgi:N-methylhydantoinase A/oxoprolinase/acetone carboxylase beta subunit|nr:hydantoinase/oxoprolinase family protein [Synergistaceae bacterium]